MPAAVLTKEQWEQVKLADLAGVPKEKICSEWDISEGALRKRRERGQWMTPTRAKIERDKAREALQNQAKLGVQSSHGTESVTETVQTKPLAVDVIAQSKEEYGETNRMVLLSKLSPVLQRAVTDRPHDFSPQDIKELVSLGSFLHKMADLDKPDASVSVSVWGGSASFSQDLRDVGPGKGTGQSEGQEMLE